MSAIKLMSSYLINVKIFISSFFVFIYIYIVSFIIVIISRDWFLVWFGLEINIISFIILIYQCNNIYNIESCLKYFFLQSLGSALLLRIFYLRNLYDYLTFIVLRIKIGAGPFFFWFPSVCIGLSWNSCYILIIYQRIIPLLLIVMFVRIIVWYIIIIRLVRGAVGRFNQSDLRCFIAYSSIHHLGWILICHIIYDNIWIMYILIYNFVLFNVIFIFNKYNLVRVNIASKIKNKFNLILGLLSIGGIPPILGFFIKWIVFSSLINIDNILLIFIILMSLVIFYVYFRIICEIVVIGGIFKSWLNFDEKEKLIGLDIIRVVGILIGIFFLIYILYISKI